MQLKDSRKMNFTQILNNNPSFSHKLNLYSGKQLRNKLDNFRKLAQPIDKGLSKQAKNLHDSLDSKQVYSLQPVQENSQQRQIHEVSDQEVYGKFHNLFHKMNQQNINQATREMDQSKVKNHTVNSNELNNMFSHSQSVRQGLKHQRVPKNFFQSTFHQEKRMVNHMPTKQTLLVNGHDHFVHNRPLSQKKTDLQDPLSYLKKKGQQANHVRKHVQSSGLQI